MSAANTDGSVTIDGNVFKILLVLIAFGIGYLAATGPLTGFRQDACQCRCERPRDGHARDRDGDVGAKIGLGVNK